MADLQVTDDGASRTITLDRPERRNALDEALIQDLTEAFRAVDEDRHVRIVVLRANGLAFSAGADLAYMRRMADFDEAENLADARRLGALFEAIEHCRCPVVSLVQGPAIGGGVGLVAASDVAVASGDAVFAFSEVRLGLVPAVISPFVVRRIGLPAAKRLFLTGDRFDAVEAHRLGLVDEVGDDLDAAVERVCGSLLQGAPGAHTATKQLVAAVDGLPLPEATRVTPPFIAAQRATPEAAEGIAAFFERRKATWATPEA
ncbi:enoyl-CoA hydratase-related protein [Candidatus Poriferisocius sp.]|uniref:enoyl-CoA hydratase-related protein n=1 Tax=Candidatus Poriferisocius sp. TaxID=3101276 RepID=UPI003B5B95A1